MKCRLCANKCNEVHQAKILNKYLIKYYSCDTCHLLQTEEPYWFEEAYANPMNLTDTGIMYRNHYMSDVASAVLGLFFNKKATFLDYAGGYGVFTRLMRDNGFDYLWYDPFTQNVLARGFEYNVTETRPIELLTTFETFEHFFHPREDLAKMLAITTNILFTTELAKEPAPAPEKWWYYGLEHGQHISLYRKETLQFIAKEYNLNLYSHRNVHLLTKKKIPQALFIAIVRQPKMFSILGRKGLKSLHYSDMLLLAPNKS